MNDAHANRVHIGCTLVAKGMTWESSECRSVAAGRATLQPQTSKGVGYETLVGVFFLFGLFSIENK